MAMLKLHSGVKRDVAKSGCVFRLILWILEIKRRHADHCFATSKMPTMKKTWPRTGHPTARFVFLFHSFPKLSRSARVTSLHIALALISPITSSELHWFWLSEIFPRQSSKSGYAKHIGSLWEALRAQSEDWVTISVHGECALHHLLGGKLHATGSKPDGTKWTRLQLQAEWSGLRPPKP